MTSLDGKPLTQIQEQDVLEIVSAKNESDREQKVIEYKETLPSNSYEDKKEFLADFSSFANASGGYLLYGIKAKDGIPDSITGLSLTNVDAEKLRLENLLRDSLEPRVLGHLIHPIKLSDSKYIFVIHIPKSWNAPHVVRLEKHWRFYSRNSAGKYPLDVRELQSAFIYSETLAKRLKDFRAERLSLIVAGETPVVIQETPKIVLHIIPINAFADLLQFDMSLVMQNSTLYASIGGNVRYNFDGILGFDWYSKINSAVNYTQLFRNGIFEFVDTRMLKSSFEDERKIIPSIAYEELLLEKMRQYFAIAKNLNIEPPLIIMVSLLGVRGYMISKSSIEVFIHGVRPIDRNDLIIPEIRVDDFSIPLHSTMKPIFAYVWNAGGWEGSMNYDKDGNWKPNR